MSQKRNRRLIGGYIWNRRLEEALAANTRARQANDRTRDVLTDIHTHLTTTPAAGLNVLLLSQLLTDAALAVAANAAALTELKDILDLLTGAFAGGSLLTGPARSVQPRGQSPGDCPLSN